MVKPLQVLALTHLIATPAFAVSWETEVHFSAVAASKFESRSLRGEVSEVDFGARAVASHQFGGGPLFRSGVEWQRYDFDVPRRLPIPDQLQSLALVVGADFQIGEAWLFRLEATPGYYHGGTELSAEGFNVPVLFGGSYFVNADLQLIAGIELDVNRKYPVLGALGVRWKFATKFVLNAVLPAPRLEYSFSKSLTGYIGADVRETTYRVSDDFARTRKQRKLDGAIVDYTQIRIGAGASWKMNANFTLGAEVGVVAFHELNYHRAGVGVKSDGYPAYGGVSLKAAF